MNPNSQREMRVRVQRLAAEALPFFAWLEGRPLPVQVERTELVDVLRNLAAAGFVQAQIPALVFKAGRAVQPPAVVTALTAAGRQWRTKLYRGPGPKRLLPSAPEVHEGET
ncbi:hypothetical protein QTI66_33955 [Variovorax sp. J22R133]|uniref:hypothetical protein n=1 Tax=Variovorax brevis TaxID=3053503 RepID=UPI0025772C1E|nr:hypothetical protein [Variovorax sp. J22R133]MDM0117130.1 hypothetical protein [Variovorax sp. J22R133]